MNEKNIATRFQSHFQECDNQQSNQIIVENINNEPSNLNQVIKCESNLKIENVQKFSVKDAKKLLEKKIRKEKKISKKNDDGDGLNEDKVETQKNSKSLREKYFNLKSHINFY